MKPAEMLERIIATDADWTWMLIRVTCGGIILPYGIQKLFHIRGWAGIRGTLRDLKNKHIPVFIAWLIIIAQSFGSAALIIGLFSRIAAAGNLIVFTGALIVHAPDGWSLNWWGKKKGEGVEYFVMLLVLLLITLIKGSGPLSVDGWIARYL